VSYKPPCGARREPRTQGSLINLFPRFLVLFAFLCFVTSARATWTLISIGHSFEPIDQTENVDVQWQSSILYPNEADELERPVLHWSSNEGGWWFGAGEHYTQFDAALTAAAHHDGTPLPSFADALALVNTYGKAGFMISGFPSALLPRAPSPLAAAVPSIASDMVTLIAAVLTVGLMLFGVRKSYRGLNTIR
jgi:hypothetical protein